MKPRVRRLFAGCLLASAALAPLAASSVPASAAASHALIAGSGSTWAANAVNQWISDVNKNPAVDFTASGSETGRKDFANELTDFAVTDIPYGEDPNDTADNPNGRPFAYLPVVAGGTAFAYNLSAFGQRITNLRLSGLTLAKIFTNQITTWSDPAITKDNNGHAMPSIPIVPVVRSDGSGATAQFTRYLATQYPSVWSPFSKAGGQNGGETEEFPRQGSQLALNGSDGVINFVASPSGNGSIAFDEYSYALQKNWPVAKIENSAGFYTLPSQYNVAVALLKAQIDTTDTGDPTKYLTEDLDDVYSDADPRTYPLSSYSYEIIPTGTNAQDAKLSSGIRQSIADFTDYALCNGQRDAGPLGYSALPLNLVQAAMDQIKKLGTIDPAVDVSQVNATSCNNPTFDGSNPANNVLAQQDPNPPTCDQDGQGPCGMSTAGAAATTITPTKTTSSTAAKKSTAKASTAAKSTGGSSKGATTGATAGGAATVTTTGSTGTSGSTGGTADTGVVDPGTGTTDGTTDGTATDSSTAGDSSGSATPVATTLASSPGSGPTQVLAPLAVALLLAIIAAPAFLSLRASSRVSRKPEQ